MSTQPGQRAAAYGAVAQALEDQARGPSKPLRKPHYWRASLVSVLLASLVFIPALIGGVAFVQAHDNRTHFNQTTAIQVAATKVTDVAACHLYDTLAADITVLVNQLASQTASAPNRSAAFKAVAAQRYQAILDSLPQHDCKKVQ